MTNVKILATLIFISLLFGSCNNNKNDSFDLIWSFEYTKPAEALSLAALPPAVFENSVMIAPDNQVTLLSLNSGKLKWQFQYPSGKYIGNNEFLLEEDRLFLSEADGDEVYALSNKDGSVIWQSILEGREFFDDANDGMDDLYIYITGSNGEIFRFTKEGNFDKEYDILQFTIRDRARSIRILNNQLIFSQRFRGDECPTNVCGRILSIHKETEEVLWEYRTDNGGFIFEPILLEDEIIYAGVTDGPGEFVALNATNGEVIWKTLGIIGQSYTLTDSMVLVNDGISLLALDKFTGKELWNTGLAFGGGDGASNIGYLNGYVYHAHSGRLYVLEANTGEIVHTEERSPDGSPFQLLAVGDGKVFVQTFNALYAYTVWE